MRTVEKIAKLEVCSLAKLFISSVMLCHTKTNRGSGSHRVKNLDTENCSTFQKMMQNFAFLKAERKDCSNNAIYPKNAGVFGCLI